MRRNDDIGIHERGNRMKLKKVFFDLDGTLTDSMPGITKGVQYALKHYGIQVDDLNVLKPFVGPPLSDSFKEYYNFSEEDACSGNITMWKDGRTTHRLPELRRC